MKKLVNELKAHPQNAEIYGDVDLPKDFLESIAKNGVMVPVVVTSENIIISGHRRWQAAKKVGIEEIPVIVVNFSDKLDEYEAIIEYNKQREKTFSQKMKEAEFIDWIEQQKALQRMSDGGKNKGVETFPHLKDVGKTRDKVAEKIGIGSGRTYDKAKIIWDKAKEDVEFQKKVKEIDKGKTTISRVYDDIKKEEREANIEKRKREQTTQEIPDGLFNVIYADPPWQYDFAKDSKDKIENQYPTMTLEDIKKIEFSSADDSVLFLWATAPKLKEALEVVEAWGFTYKTHSVWDKKWFGMGFWFRGQHELLLVATKGSPGVPEKPVSSVYSEQRTVHSKKPDFYYELIESYFPEGRYLELFARQKYNENWEVWGNERL